MFFLAKCFMFLRINWRSIGNIDKKKTHVKCEIILQHTFRLKWNIGKLNKLTQMLGFRQLASDIFNPFLSQASVKMYHINDYLYFVKFTISQ